MSIFPFRMCMCWSDVEYTTAMYNVYLEQVSKMAHVMLMAINVCVMEVVMVISLMFYSE